MKRRSAPLALLVVALLFAFPVPEARALGALGHYFYAMWYAKQVLAGTIDAPAELKQALKDPVGFETFCGGAMAPDMAAGTSMTHQGRSGDRTKEMLAQAQADLTHAQTPEERTRALQEVAFSYGWMTHLGADDAVHPLINLAVGDSYRYLGAIGAAQHANYEALIDRSIYLAVGPSMDPSVILKAPILKEFASKYFGDMLLADDTLIGKVHNNLALVAEIGRNTPEAWGPRLGIALLLVDVLNLSPEKMLTVLEQQFAPGTSKYVNTPDSLKNTDHDGDGKIPSQEHDDLRADFVKYLGQEPAGNLYRELAKSISSLGADVVILRMAVEAQLKGIQQAMAGPDDATLRLQAFRRRADPLAASLRGMLADFGVVTGRADFPKGSSAGVMTVPGACQNLDQLAIQARDGRLTMTSLDQSVADTRRSLEALRTQPGAGQDLSKQAGTLAKAMTEAQTIYRDLGGSQLLAAVKTTLATRGASVGLTDALPIDTSNLRGPLSEVMSKFETKSRQLKGQLRLIATVPLTGPPPLFTDPGEPAASTTAARLADEFQRTELFKKYRTVDRAAIESRFDALQEQYDAAMALEAQLKNLTDTANRAREALRPAEQPVDTGQPLRDTQACLDRLLAIKATLATPVNNAGAAPDPPRPPVAPQNVCVDSARRVLDGGRQEFERWKKDQRGKTPAPFVCTSGSAWWPCIPESFAKAWKAVDGVVPMDKWGHETVPECAGGWATGTNTSYNDCAWPVYLGKLEAMVNKMIAACPQTK